MLSRASIPLLLMSRVFVAAAAAADARAMQDAGPAASGAALALRDKPLDATLIKKDECCYVYTFAIRSDDCLAAVYSYSRQDKGFDASKNELALLAPDHQRELWRVQVC